MHLCVGHLLIIQPLHTNTSYKHNTHPYFPTCSKDKPEDLGFPAVEPTTTKKAADGQDKPKPSVLKQLVNNVLKNPFIWGMALTYFFIYIVRQVCVCVYNEGGGRWSC